MNGLLFQMALLPNTFAFHTFSRLGGVLLKSKVLGGTPVDHKQRVAAQIQYRSNVFRTHVRFSNGTLKRSGIQSLKSNTFQTEKYPPDVQSIRLVLNSVLAGFYKRPTVPRYGRVYEMERVERFVPVQTTLNRLKVTYPCTAHANARRWVKIEPSLNHAHVPMSTARHYRESAP